jgi:Zn-dependent peptidase ImmA (M78 family)
MTIQALIDLMTFEEATIIISQLRNLAKNCGVSIHELRFIGNFNGFYGGRRGNNPIIVLETKLPPPKKAWVLAHEMGHLFTIEEILKDERETVDLIFGENKGLIAKVERAANEWAISYLIGQLKNLRNLNQKHKIDTPAKVKKGRTERSPLHSEAGL